MTLAQMIIPVQTEEMDATVKQFLDVCSEELARETGFVQRKSAITGAIFAQALIFGWLIKPEGSYTHLQQMLSVLECEASAQALEQRMTASAADFLLSLLHALLGICMESQGMVSQVLDRFNGVSLQDGTLITLPASLAPIYPGLGADGKGRQRSALRVQARLNLQSGSLQGPWLQAAAMDEQAGASSLSQAPLPTGSLFLTDSAYVNLSTMKQAQQEGRFWLTHARADWSLTDASGVRKTLVQWLASHPQEQEVIDEWVTLGQQASKRQRVRILAYRVGSQTAERRREEAHKVCKTRPKGSRRNVRVGKKHQRPSIDGRHRRKTSGKRLQLCEWTLLLTNVPDEQLSAPEARVLARCRWQIELLWRLWKERGQVDIWRSEKPMRLLCELYAKLMGLIIQHWLILRGCWSQPYRSMVKASQAVGLLALCYLLSLSGPITTQRVEVLLEQAMKRSRLNTRPTRVSTAQLLQNLNRKEA